MPAEKGYRDMVKHLLEYHLKFWKQLIPHSSHWDKRSLNEKLKKSLTHWGKGMIHHTDQQGRTALHWAALAGHPDVFEMLLEYHANPHLKDQDGKTPLDYPNRS
ncbi:MAG: ankyrin repeat domain-containing protein [SAR324 cluster bacterium]|nr:ankyrin repeat domain-containing protein [SAR324 cluster bacterium]